MRFISQSGLYNKPSGAKKMKPVSPSMKSCVLKGIRAAPCSTPSLMQTILLRYVWSQQTAARLSQVIFVKQLLLSEFFPGIIIIIWPATQSSQFGKGGRKGVHRIPKCVPKHNWQQNASLKIWLTKSFHSKLYCQIKCNSTCLKGKVTGNDQGGGNAQKLEITYFFGKKKPQLL